MDNLFNGFNTKLLNTEDLNGKVLKMIVIKDEEIEIICGQDMETREIYFISQKSIRNTDSHLKLLELIDTREKLNVQINFCNDDSKRSILADQYRNTDMELNGLINYIFTQC